MGGRGEGAIQTPRRALKNYSPKVVVIEGGARVPAPPAAEEDGDMGREGEGLGRGEGDG